MRYLFILFLLTNVLTVAKAQKLKPQQIEELATFYTNTSFPLLREILSIPNDANYPDHVENNVVWCENAFTDRKFSTQRIETGAVPLLLAERNVKKAKKTVLIYLQIDGQPVDSSRWFQESPYTPVLKEQDIDGSWNQIAWERLADYNDDWRVFARAASDAKGPVAMFLSAIDAVEEVKKEPNFNMKVIMDFEEELGSPHLPQAVIDNQELLGADMLIIFDGPRHITNKPTLTFGARGIATIQLTTYGPIVPQHSGHFGNYAPNPVFKMSNLLASMKDQDGIVTIPGYYEGISIDAETEKILKAVPDDEAGIQDRLEIATADKVGSYYQESIQYPSLNVRGLQSGWINENVRTIIPAWARAEIDVRMVMETNPERQIGLIKKHVEDQGFYVIDHKPTKEERLEHKNIATFTYEVSYLAYRTPFDSEVGIWLRQALNHTFGEEPIMIRTSGGSIPISPFVNTLGIPAVTVPTVNRDNNQHSPNENLRIGNYREGIQAMIGILSQPLK